MSNIFNFNSYIESDMYKVNNGLPLEGESHSRYLPTKTPVRKNKDYKARPRNYVIGFPVYKKDHYTRNWYNLVDVFNSNDAPAIKYSKSFFMGSLSGLFFSFAYNIINNTESAVKGNHIQMQADYTKLNVFHSFRSMIKMNYAFALGFGVTKMTYSMFKNWIM